MSRIYDKAFKFGVKFNIAAFIVLNLVSFVLAYRAYHDPTRLIRFSGEQILWGFPFDWRNGAGFPVGLVLNVIVITFFGFVFGFLFKYIYGKIGKKKFKHR